MSGAREATGAASGLGTVADLLGTKSSEVIVAQSTEPVRDVIARLKAHGISQLPVLEGGRLIGAIAEVDLLRHLVGGSETLSSPVGPLVQHSYATVTPLTGVEELTGLLSEARMAVVMEGPELRGVITKIDVIDYLARRS